MRPGERGLVQKRDEGKGETEAVSPSVNLDVGGHNSAPDESGAGLEYVT